MYTHAHEAADCTVRGDAEPLSVSRLRHDRTQGGYGSDGHGERGHHLALTIMHLKLLVDDVRAGGGDGLEVECVRAEPKVVKVRAGAAVAHLG